MKQTVRQTRRMLIFLLCGGIALSLAQVPLLHDAAIHDPNGVLARGMAGRPEKLPGLEKQQVDCANARPTFQGSVAPASIRANAPPSEQAELVIFNQSFRPQAGLLRAHSGRAPPYTFSR